MGHPGTCEIPASFGEGVQLVLSLQPFEVTTALKETWGLGNWHAFMTVAASQGHVIAIYDLPRQADSVREAGFA